ncbi:putative membrane protein [Nocardiopsis sp. Huas11]|nr:putative membrane protein [Nocardiopsis sp. Huas11]
MHALVPVIAVVSTGLFAGLFFAFSIAVMPGLGRAGDRAMIEAMQGVNVAILNPWFAVVFVGAPVTVLASLVLHASSAEAGSALWSAAALVLLVAVYVITFAVNVPRNNILEQAGPVERIGDPAAVRAHFEGVWVRWNHVRTLASLVALVCAAAAMITH